LFNTGRQNGVQLIWKILGTNFFFPCSCSCSCSSCSSSYSSSSSVRLLHQKWNGMVCLKKCDKVQLPVSLKKMLANVQVDDLSLSTYFLSKFLEGRRRTFAPFSPFSQKIKVGGCTSHTKIAIEKSVQRSNL